MNVFMNGTPIFAAASMTCLMWAMAGSRTSRVGVQRVRVVAEAGDRQALRRDLVDDLVACVLERFATSICDVPA